MTPRPLSVSSRIGVPAATVYAVIADYREDHPKILPRPPFTSLEVERGGYGAGTAVRVGMRVLGRSTTFRAEVTEPEPGRVLVETNDTGWVTSFTVDPLDDGRAARVTISTVGPRGAARALERWVARRPLRAAFARELQLLAEVAAARAE